jgi:hypothetical protein
MTYHNNRSLVTQPQQPEQRVVFRALCAACCGRAARRQPARQNEEIQLFLHPSVSPLGFLHAAHQDAAMGDPSELCGFARLQPNKPVTKFKQHSPAVFCSRHNARARTIDNLDECQVGFWAFVIPHGASQIAICSWLMTRVNISIKAPASPHAETKDKSECLYLLCCLIPPESRALL